jgi:uncharacterized HAD superfamily protein
MAKPVLAVDFDDVVAGFQRAFMYYHNHYHGTDITYDGITSYLTHDVYGTTPEIIGERIMDFCANHHDSMLPIEGALESLEKLKRKYLLIKVTSRCESLRPVTYSWWNGHSQKTFLQAYFTNNFETKFPELRRSKLSVCEEIEAVALIDDASGHAVAAGAGIPVFLPTRPWNKDAELSEGVIRVTDWDEITKQLLS